MKKSSDLTTESVLILQIRPVILDENRTKSIPGDDMKVDSVGGASNATAISKSRSGISSSGFHEH